jgi:NitT/TauT family transport system substrate-binding protein
MHTRMTPRRSRTPVARLAALALALALSAALAGCGDDGGSTASGGKGAMTMTVAALPLVDTAPLYVAQNEGLFKKEGLEVTIQPVQQSIQALPALSNGQVDVIAGANYVTFLQAHEKGTLDLRVVAEGARLSSQMMGVLVPKDSPVKSVADLKGKSVAVNILNNIQSLTLNAILADQGAPLPEYRQIAFPQMGPALQKGQVDAVHAVEPFFGAIQRQLGARILVDGGSAPVQSLPISGYVTTAGYAGKNQAAVAAFQRALSAAMTLAGKDDGAAARTQLPTYAKVSADEAKSIHLPEYPTSTDPAQLSRLVDLMRKQGLLKQNIDPATLVAS